MQDTHDGIISVGGLVSKQPCASCGRAFENAADYAEGVFSFPLCKGCRAWQLATLVTRISAARLPNVFNPWGEADPMDLNNAQGVCLCGPEGRQRRLLQHFNCAPAFLLVGEAPGYQGAHFSGVAFTSEKMLMAGQVPRVSETSRLTDRKLPWSEPSATVMWDALQTHKLADRVVMWNAFAWHPFEPNQPLSNRTPSREELEAGLPVLRAVLSHFDGVPVITVGKKAEEAMAALKVGVCAALRHPSMGGANVFRRGLQELINKDRTILERRTE